jgi:hypothetical protein
MRHDPNKHEPNKSARRSDQIEITVRSGDTFAADAELVDLLLALNAAGLHTYSHCAGHLPDAPAWVVLDLEDLEVEVRPARTMGNGVVRPAQVILWWTPTWNMAPAASEPDALGRSDAAAAQKPESLEDQ